MGAVPFAKALTLTRQTGSYVSGTWTPAASSSVAVMASVQPAVIGALNNSDVEMLLRLGEQATQGAVRILCESEILGPRAGGEGDRFTWRGKTYEICQVKYWPEPKEHWTGLAGLVTSTHA